MDGGGGDEDEEGRVETYGGECSRTDQLYEIK
jgi:hypothetical protein